MNILVNASANNERGPFSLTDAFLNDMKSNNDFLKEHNIFLDVIVSNPSLLKYATDNINIKNCQFVKKSIYHKIFFEKIFIKKILLKKRYEAYLSLQNIGLEGLDIPQYILVQTSLPYSDIGVNDLEFKLYLKYKIILRSILKKNLLNADTIIVQTNWMKNAIQKDIGEHKKIKVIRPPIKKASDNTPKVFDSQIEAILNDKSYIKLFYPTNKDKYKNNGRIIEAVKRFNKENKKNKVKLIITLEGNSDENIIYTGRIPFPGIFSVYPRVDALVFPSLTETLGLPLIEAEYFHIPRIVSNRPYAYEICQKYAYYFDPMNIESMVDAIKEFVKDKELGICKINSSKIELNSSYMDYIKLILSDREGKQ